MNRVSDLLSRRKFLSVFLSNLYLSQTLSFFFLLRKSPNLYFTQNPWFFCLYLFIFIWFQIYTLTKHHLFIHDGIYNSVADYNSSKEGVGCQLSVGCWMSAGCWMSIPPFFLSRLSATLQFTMSVGLTVWWSVGLLVCRSVGLSVCPFHFIFLLFNHF